MTTKDFMNAKHPFWIMSEDAAVYFDGKTVWKKHKGNPPFEIKGMSNSLMDLISEGEFITKEEFDEY